MIRLIEKQDLDRKIKKWDCIRYSLVETSTINTSKVQIYINIPKEDSVISLVISYLDLNFEVIEKADESRYANGNYTRLVNLGCFAISNNSKLTKRSGRHFEDISHAHIVSFFYKLMNSAKDSDALSIEFDRDR